MFQHKTIRIIKTDENKRQVKFAHFALDEFQELEEAKKFALNYEYGKTVEVWDGDVLVEEFDK